jgi:hypothetical protein
MGMVSILSASRVIAGEESVRNAAILVLLEEEYAPNVKPGDITRVMGLFSGQVRQSRTFVVIGIYITLNM